MTIQHIDFLIVGAGISGISAAWHIKNDCPSKTFAILEGRQAIGGTWDLFKYPGIRSDSDMFTLGFSFKPWTGVKSLADGRAIREYVEETAVENDLKSHIHFGHNVIHSNWSTEDQLWTVEAVRTDTNETVFFTCNFLMMCTGYYDYAEGFRPKFAGEENFKGQIVHPQHWPENFDYTDKNVVVIGSGATAVTLIPAMADKTKHITMLQRSPTYVASVPAEDLISVGLRKILPEKLVYRLGRARNVALQMGVYKLSRTQPAVLRKFLLEQVKFQIGNKVDMKHFTPTYNPWDERLCAVPNGDLFKVLKKGTASVVTDTIKNFTETGILLNSGETLDADIIITATGLNIQLLGGSTVSVDGQAMDLSKSLNYKGIMLENIPNFSMTFGYTNSSWTLKADLSSQYVCKVVNYMDKKGYSSFVPVDQTPDEASVPFVNMRSGYIQRAAKIMPRQSGKFPWKVSMSYAQDLLVMRYKGIEDGVLTFTKKAKTKSA